jgi:segregation and condensation protein B
MSSEITELKKIIEGAVLASSKPVNYDRLLNLFDESARPAKADLVAAFKSLQEDYQGRGIELQEVSSGLRFQVAQSVTPWVTRLQEERPQRYSRALLETIAIIAYRQPLTRGDIEEIRGVAVSTQIIKTLQEREWVRVVGHRDVPGRPALYATTRQFLDYFNLKNLDELPPLSELKDLEQLNRELDLDEETVEALQRMIASENQQAEIVQTADDNQLSNQGIDEVIDETKDETKDENINESLGEDDTDDVFDNDEDKPVLQ